MQNPPKISKITGPPGCGKSTYLKKQIVRACDKFAPSRIGAVTFTNAGVEQIRAEIASTTGQSKEVAKNARTIHSHCFKLLKLNGDVIAERNVREFNALHPGFAIKIDKLKDQDEDSESWRENRHAEKLFSEMQVNRNRMIPEEQWMPDVQAIWDAWSAWMAEAGYVDFTGMLERTLALRLRPDIDVLFVDETQDLSPLQFELMKMWSKKCVSTVYAGDADQAIYRFAGTVPEAFITLEHDWRHLLDQSYRVPHAVHAYAEQIIGLAKNREVTAYKPVSSGMDTYKGEGRVYRCFSPDLTLPGMHMILCRCKFQVPRWIDILMKNNYLWHNPYRPEDLSWNPTRTISWIAARTYYDLMRGKIVKGKRFKKMVEKIQGGFLVRGTKTRIKDMENDENIDLFNLANLGFNNDFIDAIRPVSEVIKLTQRVTSILRKTSTIEEAEKMLMQEPKVIIGTIHSVKGGEADHVWLDTSLSPLIYREIRNSNEAFYDECRVAYVAATRAKQTLGLVSTRDWSPVLPQEI